MTEYGGAGAHRVFLRQALGGDELLRVTWHEGSDVFVFSHWIGDTCSTATPVRVAELGDLASMTVAALAQRAALTEQSAPWPAPDAAGRTDLGVARPA
jgi:hypothetical protein